MAKETEIVIPPALITNENAIKKLVSRQLHIAVADISSVQLLKRSIDARSKHTVYRVKAKVYFQDEEVNSLFVPPTYKKVKGKDPVYIIGAGPAGLFAALRLIELGRKPIIIERGKDVKQRRRDLATINKEQVVNPDSNYCFGEGGAGTYSDGKLYTRSTKRGDVEAVLATLVQHGASPSILIDARPHIGTNKLPQVITSIRETILEQGGEIWFDTKLTDLQITAGKIKAIQINNQDWLPVTNLILATGHSARDIFYLLHERGVSIEAKPFALGVRIEHPQALIDQAQYKCTVREENLPPAYYSLVEQVDERGVFSFCMCPGGIIAPCATDAEEIVVNGWSPSKRNNPFANSGMVVQLDLEDIPNAAHDPLAALRYQQIIEQDAYKIAGGGLKAPAQRMIDFVERRISEPDMHTSYIPGVTAVDLHALLPKHVASRLQMALPAFDKKMKGYYTNEAILVGVESRTSSPVRIPRDKQTLQHPQVLGLYPCAEGAGYAGGIVSAAIDGQRCAEAIINS